MGCEMGTSRAPFIGQEREGKGQGQAESASREGGANYVHYSSSFHPVLMAIDGNERSIKFGQLLDV